MFGLMLGKLGAVKGIVWLWVLLRGAVLGWGARRCSRSSSTSNRTTDRAGCEVATVAVRSGIHARKYTRELDEPGA